MYRDVQRMRDSRVYRLVLIVTSTVTAIFLVGVYVQVIKGHPWGTSPMSNRGLILTFLFIVLMNFLTAALLRSMELVVEVRDDGIYYRLKPFQSSLKRISFAEIERIEFPRGLKYGIGVHFGLKWKAYTITNNQVKIVLRNGNSLILSVKNIPEFKESLRYAGFKV